MKRLHKYMMILSAVVLMSVVSMGPVAAQEWTVPETISNAQELAEYQMHMMDIQAPVETEAVVSTGAIDRNELPGYQAELADSIGVTPAPQTVPWYVEFNEINDCNKLAQYQARVMDINALAIGF